jgi:ABC-type molybdate transport system ATPase subunit
MGFLHFWSVNYVRKFNSNIKIEIIYLSLSQLENKRIKKYCIHISTGFVVVDLALTEEEAHENDRLTIFRL